MSAPTAYMGALPQSWNDILVVRADPGVIPPAFILRGVAMNLRVRRRRTFNAFSVYALPPSGGFSPLRFLGVVFPPAFNLRPSYWPVTSIHPPGPTPESEEP